MPGFSTVFMPGLLILNWSVFLRFLLNSQPSGASADSKT
jgi:hypothetical protein